MRYAEPGQQCLLGELLHEMYCKYPRSLTVLETRKLVARKITIHCYETEGWADQDDLEITDGWWVNVYNVYDPPQGAVLPDRCPHDYGGEHEFGYISAADALEFASKFLSDDIDVVIQVEKEVRK